MKEKVQVRCRFEEKTIGRTHEFVIQGCLPIEVARVLRKTLKATFKGSRDDLSADVNGHISIRVMKSFEHSQGARILTGVKHNLYDSYATQFDQTLSTIRNTLGIMH